MQAMRSCSVSTWKDDASSGELPSASKCRGDVDQYLSDRDVREERCTDGKDSNSCDGVNE